MLVFPTNGQHLLALGLFVTGCSPGGGASNYWTLLLGGNANLSITMTFVSTIGALGMLQRNKGGNGFINLFFSLQ
jgi:sodium/bile acid cotransporter 3/5